MHYINRSHIGGIKNIILYAYRLGPPSKGNILYQLVQRHYVILVIGITLGLLSSIFITTQVVSQPYQRRHLLYQIKGENYPRYLRQELTVHKTLYIGVISNNLKSTQAVHSTWGRAAVRLEYVVDKKFHAKFAKANLSSKEMKSYIQNNSDLFPVELL